MGCFDSVYVDCPACGKPVEFQSKVHECCMNTFDLKNAPAEILWDIMNQPNYCMKCGHWLALIDPRFPPGEMPKPELKAAKVKAPDNPQIHQQGFQWWPEGHEFTFDDLEEPAA